MDIIDLVKEITLHLHPYHVTTYLRVNKKHCKLLGKWKSTEWKYNIVRKWICPSLSLEETKKMFPILSWNDVIELSLYYHPIIESIGKFDKFSLFYSCMQSSSYVDPRIFCDSEDPADTSVLGWVCYKFKRLDIIKNLSNTYPNDDDLLIIIDIMNLRVNPKAKVKYHYYNRHLILLVEAAIYLLDRDELLEILIIASGLVKDKTLFNYLLDPNPHHLQQLQMLESVKKLIDSLIHIHDWPYIANVIRKYYPYYNIPQAFPQHNGINHYWKLPNSTRNTNFDYFLTPERVNILPLDSQLVFHLTRGDYISYIRLRNLGVKIIVDKHTIVGTNNCGYISFNKAFETTFNAYVQSRTNSIDLIIDINNDCYYLRMSPLGNPWAQTWF